MTYTDEQTATIQRWLDDHWLGKARCPAGHDDDWSMGSSMSFMPGFVSDETGTRIAHELGFRSVVVTCGQCGYVALLDPGTMGIGA